MTDARASETWTITKPAVESAHGLVASQHHLASDIGAEVLAQGGNAIDAAVATSLAIGTVEPWMSGLGGGGFMLIYRAREDRVDAVDFGMRAPLGLDPAFYPLTGGSAADLFGWPAVVDDRNLLGFPSMAVPGYVAGIALALERFGTRGWGAMIAPAVELAEQGMIADWYATLLIATATRQLSGFAESARAYLPDGFPPVGEWGAPPPRLKLGNLATTLRRLRDAGPRDFYEGQIARALIADCQAGGSTLAAADLADYQARVLPTERALHRGATIDVAPGLTAGPTLLAALAGLGERASGESPDAAAYLAYAESLRDAYSERLATMGDSDEARAPSCTTHINVVDRDGNFVALTQTLLSLFGSKTMLPDTGVLMNNGIMWFDPRPDRPNSIAAGKRPLSNMCPAIISRPDGVRIALGASGGRRIMPAVFQLTSFLCDYGMDVGAAFAQPRIDVSGTDIVGLDNRLGEGVVAALGQRFATRRDQHGVFPAMFACPNAVSRSADGAHHSGAAFITSPWAKVSAPPA